MDRYEVLELIGRGSFGEIRKVRRIHDGAILCRKEILWRKMKQREREQLQAEMRILASLQHKHIVQYIEQVTDQSTKMVYIYMEYCGNGDLHELITARKEQNPGVKFAEAMIWQVFSQLCLALYRCHNGFDAPPPRMQNTVLHRDIKPQNIFLDHDNRVKLGDFGLSKEVTGPGLADTYVGTPFYMSPEIIAGRAYNAKSDIWAMGCCIYELCTFEPPFLARDQQELNVKIKAGQITSVTRHGYSESLDRAIRACLSQSEQRRPSAATLLRMQEMHLARR
ncbi:kinase-like domain-containing protein, partial [Protomyces lactucae-debilis]